MLLYVIRHERAQRHDLEALGARVVQYLPDEAAAEAATLAGGVDLGMGDGKSPPAPVVSGEADQPPVEPQLVARGFRNVHDLRQLRLGRARRLQLTGRAEIFDQVTGGVGLAGGQVLVKAFALPDNMRAPGSRSWRNAKMARVPLKKRPSSVSSVGISSLPARSRSLPRSSGHGSTCRATKPMSSSVSTWRTAEENGHHSA